MSADRPPRPRLRTRLYLLLQSGYRRLVAGTDAVWTGFWLGMMSRRDFHAVDAALYDRRSAYRSEAHNGRGLFDWEEEALAAHFPGAGSLLVIGAGGGREVLALAARGYAVDAYECNPALVEYAAGFLAEEGCTAGVALLARDAAPAEGGPYAGAIVGWSAYMLVAGSARRAELLRGIRARLRAGAPVLVSFFTRSGDSSRQRIVRSVAGALRRLRRDEPAEMGDDLDPNYVHRFTEAEVAAEMEAAGVRLERFQPEGYGAYSSGWAVGTVA